LPRGESHAAARAQVVVVGDIIVDRYFYGDVTRVSPEAPVPILENPELHLLPGGAANVANVINELGVSARLVGVTGADRSRDFLLTFLTERGVQFTNFIHPSAGTIVKSRFVSNGHHLLRVDHDYGMRGFDYSALLRYFEVLAEKPSVLVISDYSKGISEIIPELISWASRNGVKCLIDPKGSRPQIYSGADLITPNWQEASLLFSQKPELQLLDRVQQATWDFDLGSVLVTDGPNGMFLVARAGQPIHHQAAEAEVYDVTGAGDAVIGSIASALAQGIGLSEAIGFAARVAGYSVKISGGGLGKFAGLAKGLLNDLEARE